MAISDLDEKNTNYVSQLLFVAFVLSQLFGATIFLEQAQFWTACATCLAFAKFGALDLSCVFQVMHLSLHAFQL